MNVEIEARIKARGVKIYGLGIVAKGEKVIGFCENSKKQIVYKK